MKPEMAEPGRSQFCREIKVRGDPVVQICKPSIQIIICLSVNSLITHLQVEAKFAVVLLTYGGAGVDTKVLITVITNMSG